MSEFGGLWKHEETQHALKSGIIVSLLTVATIQKKKKKIISRPPERRVYCQETKPGGRCYIHVCHDLLKEEPVYCQDKSRVKDESTVRTHRHSWWQLLYYVVPMAQWIHFEWFSHTKFVDDLFATDCH